MTIKLHCFGESGHSYKAALTLELTGLDWEPIFVDFFNGQSRSAEYRTLNVMGEAPVMIDGEVTLSQSGVIQDYISSKTGKLGGRSAAARREILRWQFWDNHKMSSQAGVTRFLMNFIPKDKQPTEVIAWLQGRLQAAFQVLEAELTDKPWLAGEEMSIADISCCSYLFYDEPFGFERKAWPNIDAWLSRISDTPGWKHPYDLMPGSPADRA